MEKIRAANQIPRVRVEPTQDDYRAVLKHPNGTRFRESGSVEWPMDRFTQRRINEGSIKIVESAEEHRQENGEHESRRQRAAHASSPPSPEPSSS
jgi:hypothetical protein